jgi:hypothetical protein
MATDNLTVLVDVKVLKELEYILELTKLVGKIFEGQLKVYGDPEVGAHVKVPVNQVEEIGFLFEKIREQGEKRVKNIPE